MLDTSSSMGSVFIGILGFVSLTSPVGSVSTETACRLITFLSLYINFVNSGSVWIFGMKILAVGFITTKITCASVGFASFFCVISYSSSRCFLPLSVGASGNIAIPSSMSVHAFTSINASVKEICWVPFELLLLRYVIKKSILELPCFISEVSFDRLGNRYGIMSFSAI